MKLIHLYSRNNSGDGLLVDLSMKAIAQVGGGNNIKQPVALDPDSFPEFSDCIGLDVVSKEGIPRFVAAAKTVLYLFGVRRFCPIPLEQEKQTAFAVGGGYMRNKTIKESLKFSLAHLGQLKWAVSQRNITSVYLPQSIGPLTGFVGLYCRHLLKKADLVFLRDDVSYDLVRKLNANTYRIPDLAVQELSERISARHHRITGSKVFVIARKVDLGRSYEYERRIKELLASIGDFELVVQSSGRGNNDSDFYRELGYEGPFRKVSTALAEESGVVVSVRLHGAIQSMMQGCPTIHLSYERKGFGAYQDLNIKEYVHNYHSFCVEDVISQIDALRKNSDFYWERVSQSSIDILSKRDYMIDLIRAKMEGGL